MSKSSDRWLNDYEATERLGQTVSQKLIERSKHAKTSNQYSNVSANIRVLLNKFNSLIITLSKNLEDASNNGNLTQHEYARRCGLVNQLKTDEKKFQKSLRDDDSSFQNTNSANDSLWGDVNENQFTQNISSEQLLAQHDTIILQQDRGLDTLSQIVTNQKQIAITIGNEVDRQNVMIDNIGDKMDNVHERLIKETKHVKIIDRKSSTFGLWFLIILLLIAIIVIVCIPKSK